jgi:hypothetical protein
MPRYLAETFLARGAAGRRALLDSEARRAATELTNLGTSIRFRGSIHVPSDELCFLSFEAPNAADVRKALQRVGLEPLRVVEAVHSRAHRTATERNDKER